MSAAALSQRLLAIPATRDRYVARLRALLADVWSADALIADVDAMAAVLRGVMGNGGAPWFLYGTGGVLALAAARLGSNWSSSESTSTFCPPTPPRALMWSM